MEVSSNGVSMKKKKEQGVLPKFGEFQLLGDSIFVRFAKCALQQRPTGTTPSNTLGYCVGGQRINQLRQKIKRNDYFLSRKVMVLIGTNDVLCGRTLDTMIRHFQKLLRLLRIRSVVKIVILTLPPVPKLSLTRSHWRTLRGFNRFLLSLDSPISKIRVLDILPLFLKCDCPVLLNPPPDSKRRSSSNTEGTPAKVFRKLVPIEDEAIKDEDKKKALSVFCQYLNRVNKEDAQKEAESSDDDESVKQLPPFVDFYFLRLLQQQLPEKEELPTPPTPSDSNSQYLSPLSTPPRSPSRSLSVTPLSSLSGPTAPKNGIGHTPSPNSFEERAKTILEWTDRFIRLDFYEKYYYHNKLDMIHPNETGLVQLKHFIMENDII